MNCFNKDFLFPIDPHRRQVMARWERLQIGVPFSDLEDHVRRQHPAPGDCGLYCPTFAIAAEPAAWDRFTKPIKRKQIAALEAAVAYCLAAKVPEPKAMHDLLAGVRVMCDCFDALEAAEEDAIRKRAECRVKGGKARQERLRPVREYAVHLCRKLQPEGGWKSATAAARAIESQVKEFASRHGYSIFSGNDYIRTIRGWLKANGSLSASES